MGNMLRIREILYLLEEAVAYNSMFLATIAVSTQGLLKRHLVNIDMSSLVFQPDTSLHGFMLHHNNNTRTALVHLQKNTTKPI